MSVRKTIRISKEIENRIIKLVNTGSYFTQNEVIRRALIIGLDHMEKQK